MTRIARNSPDRDVTSAAIGVGALALLGGVALLGRRGGASGSERMIRLAARTMGASIMADSAMEHRRGSYHNAAMYLAPALAALSTLLAGKRRRGARYVHAAAIGTGIAGLGFHAWNLLKRPGRISWNNLFYGAPIAAPGGLILTGVLALADGARTRGHGRLLGASAALGTLAETAEVALLHDRGAWHNPAMLLPVSVPPAAAALLLKEAIRPSRTPRFLPRAVLRLMAAMGIVGTGFHIYGVSRNMGGWGNWRQTAFAGPPVPAPSSFTALALAGEAALGLIEDRS